MGIPQIIQVMDDHDFVLKPSGDLEIPCLKNPPIQLCKRNLREGFYHPAQQSTILQHGSCIDTWELPVLSKLPGGGTWRYQKTKRAVRICLMSRQSGWVAVRPVLHEGLVYLNMSTKLIENSHRTKTNIQLKRTYSITAVSCLNLLPGAVQYAGVQFHSTNKCVRPWPFSDLLGLFITVHAISKGLHGFAHWSSIVLEPYTYSNLWWYNGTTPNLPKLTYHLCPSNNAPRHQDPTSTYPWLSRPHGSGSWSLSISKSCDHVVLSETIYCSLH